MLSLLSFRNVLPNENIFSEFTHVQVCPDLDYMNCSRTWFSIKSSRAKIHPEHCFRDRGAPPHSHPALQALHSGNLYRNITIQVGVKVTVTKVNHEVQAVPRCTAPTCGAGTMAGPPLL